MIVTEIYRGSGLGNQIWNLVVSRILAHRHGYKWGVKKSTPFKARKFMPDFDYGEEVTGGHTPREGQPPESFLMVSTITFVRGMILFHNVVIVVSFLILIYGIIFPITQRLMDLFQCLSISMTIRMIFVSGYLIM